MTKEDSPQLHTADQNIDKRLEISERYVYPIFLLDPGKNESGIRLFLRAKYPHLSSDDLGTAVTQYLQLQKELQEKEKKSGNTWLEIFYRKKRKELKIY